MYTEKKSTCSFLWVGANGPCGRIQNEGVCGNRQAAVENERSCSFLAVVG